MRLLFSLVLLGSWAMAEPITYDLDAPTGTEGGTLSGFVTWDFASAPLPSQLTLSAAEDWSFSYTPFGGVAITFAKGDGSFVFSDISSFSGVYGVTDLTPLSGHDWTPVRAVRNSSGALIGNTFVHLSNDPLASTPAVWNYVLDGGPLFRTGDHGSPWTLTLRPDSQPVPEPGTFVMIGVGLIGAVILRRRSWCKHSA